MRSHSLLNKVQIAVIGGNGFIGRAIIHRLSVYKNIRIFSIDKMEHGITIDTSKSKAIIEQVRMDVGNEGAIQSWLAAHPVDVILYLAGYESPTDGLSLTIDGDLKALLGLQRTLNAIQSMNIEDYEERPYFMYISSASIYGNSKKLLTEKSKEYPSNFSGMNKLIAEDVIKRSATMLNVPFCILRPTEVYGRKDNKQLLDRKYWPGYVSYYLDRVLKKPEELEVWSPNTEIDLVNINYLTKVMSNFIENKVQGIYNVASGDKIKIIDLVTLLSINTSSTTRLKPSNRLTIDSMNVCSNKATSLIPYDKKYSFAEFLLSYIPIRRLELARNMTIEDILSEPISLDTTTPEAKQAYEERKDRRKITYNKIKEIAGDQFFDIKLGRLQERAKELLDMPKKPNKTKKLKTPLLEQDNKVAISIVKLDKDKILTHEDL